MKTLISQAEKIMKKLEKEGKVEILDGPEYLKIFDKVEQDMEEYRIDENYRRGMSRMDSEKVIIYQNIN
jgi:hypothetical protein